MIEFNKNRHDNGSLILVALLIFFVFLFAAGTIYNNIKSYEDEETATTQQAIDGKSEKFNLVYVYSDTCGVCQQQKPIWEEIQTIEKYQKNFNFTKLNVNKPSEGVLVENFDELKYTNKVPALYILDKKAELIDLHTGLIEQEDYENMLNEIIVDNL